MHTYKCARCGHVFKVENFADKCPECRCRVLVHADGERRRGRKNCSGGNCSSCGGCSCHS